MTAYKHNRRSFIKLAAIASASQLVKATDGLSQASSPVQLQLNEPKFSLGLASYTLRNFKLDQVLTISKKIGLKYLCFKDVHLAINSTPEQISEVVTKVKDAGCELYAGGVIYMTSESQVNQAFDYAKAAGLKIIIGSPNHDLLQLVEKKVQQYDIKIAIHNHGPGDKNYPTAGSVYELIKDRDKRIGLCLDIGHTKRLGLEPSDDVEKFRDRLLDVHIKDVTSADSRGGPVEVGRGVIDIPKFLTTLLKTDYSNIVSFEYEKDGADPIAGLAESVGYVRGTLAGIKANV